MPNHKYFSTLFFSSLIWIVRAFRTMYEYMRLFVCRSVTIVPHPSWANIWICLSIAYSVYINITYMCHTVNEQLKRHIVMLVLSIEHGVNNRQNAAEVEWVSAKKKVIEDERIVEKKHQQQTMRNLYKLFSSFSLSRPFIFHKHSQ